jgi:putative DNA primase/helicase
METYKTAPGVGNPGSAPFGVRTSATQIAAEIPGVLTADRLPGGGDEVSDLAAFAACLWLPDDLVEIRPIKRPVDSVGDDDKVDGKNRRWIRAADLATPGTAKLINNLAVRLKRNVHMGVNPRTRDGGGTNRDVAIARVHFQDFDPVKADGVTAVTVDDVLTLVSLAGLPEPTAILVSGNGIHVYWLRETPLTDLDRWRRIQIAIARALRRAMKSTDMGGRIVVDELKDPARVMRLPSTLNHKSDPPTRVRLVEVDASRRYTDAAFPKPSVEFKATAAPAQVTAVTLDRDDLPAFLKDFLQTGKPIAPGGRRDNCFTASCELAARNVPVDVAVTWISAVAKTLGLDGHDLADIPRQVRGAYKQPRTPRVTSSRQTLRGDQQTVVTAFRTGVNAAKVAAVSRLNKGEAFTVDDLRQLAVQHVAVQTLVALTNQERQAAGVDPIDPLSVSGPDDARLGLATRLIADAAVKELIDNKRATFDPSTQTISAADGPVHAIPAGVGRGDSPGFASHPGVPAPAAHNDGQTSAPEERLATTPDAVDLVADDLHDAGTATAGDPEKQGKTTSDNRGSVRFANSNLGNPTAADAPADPETTPVSDVDPRVTIEYRDTAQAAVVDQCLAVMAERFFVRSGMLVHIADPSNKRVAASAAGASVIVASTKQTVADFLSRRVRFEAFRLVTPEGAPKGAEKEWQRYPIPTPNWIPDRLVGMQTWNHLRELVAVAHGPFLRDDGTIGGQTAGFDDASGIMVLSRDGWPAIPDTPSDDDARQAVRLLLDVVKEFPFSNPSGKSVWLSAVLSAIARPAINGPVPLHVIDASTRGAGKSKLAKLVSLIAEGVEPAMESLTPRDDEMDKRVTAVLQAGTRVVCFDNQSGSIGGPSLDRFLTCTVWGGRLLGTNTMLRLPNMTVPMATGNNCSITADTARRCLALRLTPDDERPEERTFQVADLEHHVRQRRPELLTAALVILRHHAAKGFPEYTVTNHQADDGTVTSVPVRPKGSFEAWTRVVRGALIGVGMPDPEVTAASIRSVDTTNAAQRAFIESLYAWRSSWNGSARHLLAEVYGDDLPTPQNAALRESLEDLIDDRFRRDGVPSAKALGLVIRSIRDRWFGSMRLVSTGHGKTGNAFAIEVQESTQTA